jgi:spore germination cell wall hydrolase CwlJ-like protein
MKDSFLKLSNAQVLALTIYGEARGESTEGKIAVGSVILERVDHRDWDGKTIKEVCFKMWQFSCYLENDPNYGKLLNIAEQWNESMTTNTALNDCFCISLGLISGNIDRTPEIAAAHCCQYATAKGAENVTWDDKMKVVATIGHHIFFA